MSEKFFVMTFGCQQNEADSERLAGMAREMGYEKTTVAEEADLIIVNTCAIREHAEKKALSVIGQYKHLKEENPGLIIAVGGCMVSQNHRQEQLKKSYPYVDIVFDTTSLIHFPELVKEKKQKGKRLFLSPKTENEIREGVPVLRESTYRAWVSVMYGCNNFCTYCIVPYVRGRERSREPQAIFDEVKDLVAKGYRDITLLGQNVNSYGKDGKNCDFADLLAKLDEIEGDYVLRFMTSHPKDASKKLVDVMATGKHIAHQFHLPMQSGSSRVLHAMNRHYDREKYMETVAYIKEKMPDVTLTSDIIVGFPTETEAEFEETLSALRLVRFDMLYSFIYSPRKGTPAFDMEQVPEEVKGCRFARLLKEQNEIAYEINRALLKKPLRVLCDGVSKNNPAFYCGRTDGNKIAFFEGVPEDTGKFITFTAGRADAFALYGTKTEEQ